MNKLFTLLLAVGMTASVFAQSPEKMSYQAVVRDASNALVANAAIGMQISVLQGSAAGTAVYIETHVATSNDNGLVSIEVGGGTIVAGTFAAIDWSAGPYFLKTETDPTGGTAYTISGTSQLLSVPYAMYAKTSGSSIPGPAGPIGPEGPVGAAGPQGPTGLLPNGAATGNTPYWDGSSWVTNSSNIFNDGGNIGIGTETPSEKLHVSGGTRLGGIRIKETNSTQTGNSFWVGTNGGALIMVNFYTQCQGTSTGGLIYVESTGNVQVLTSGGTVSSSLTASANVLTINTLCAVTFSYTFTVSNGIATIATSPGNLFTTENWIILPAG